MLYINTWTYEKSVSKFFGQKSIWKGISKKSMSCFYMFKNYQNRHQKSSHTFKIYCNWVIRRCNELVLLLKAAINTTQKWSQMHAGQLIVSGKTHITWLSTATFPKSTYAIRPSRIAKIFPGCGSPWNNPNSSNCRKAALTPTVKNPFTSMPPSLIAWLTWRKDY